MFKFVYRVYINFARRLLISNYCTTLPRWHKYHINRFTILWLIKPVTFIYVFIFFATYTVQMEIAIVKYTVNIIKKKKTVLAVTLFGIIEKEIIIASVYIYVYIFLSAFSFLNRHIFSNGLTYTPLIRRTYNIIIRTQY